MAELAGATAALVINRNDPDPGRSGHLRAWADASQIGIPLIVIPKLAGGALKAAVNANPALRVSIRTHAWVAEGAHELERVASVSPSADATFACRRRRPDVLVHDGRHQRRCKGSILAVRRSLQRRQHSVVLRHGRDPVQGRHTVAAQPGRGVARVRLVAVRVHDRRHERQRQRDESRLPG